MTDTSTQEFIDKKTDLADALASRGYLDAAKIIRDERDELQAELAQVNDPSIADNDK